MDEVFGRYRLGELLGAGGMGQVFRAFDTELQRDVAIKVLAPQVGADPAFAERFRREARTAAALDEPHVVPIFDSGVIDGRLFIAMQLIAGTDVATLLKQQGPMPAQRAVEIVDQAAAALDAAHAAGLVHRDIKPANLMVAARDFAYLIDFGIARAPGELTLTATGATIGTVAYMAPERFTAGRTDRFTDIYALTCVLYECLTGDSPYPAGSVEQQMFAHISGPPPAPSRVRAGVPAALDAVIACGMASDPERRYRSAGALAEAARAALREPPRADRAAGFAAAAVAPAPVAAASRRAGAPGRVGRSGRARLLIGLAALGTTALVVAAVLGYTRWTVPDRALEADSGPVVRIAVQMAEVAATVSPGNPAASIEKAAALMVPDRADAFRESIGRSATDMADRGIAVQGQALSAGVEALGPSAARVAVVLRSTQSADGEQIKQTVVPVRITLEKRDGHWLVQELSPIHQRPT